MASLVTLFDGHGSIMQRHAADRVTQKNSLDEIVDPVMSTLTMLQQHDVGLWARSGHYINFILLTFHNQGLV